jgi:hypothetical protein
MLLEISTYHSSLRDDSWVDEIVKCFLGTVGELGEKYKFGMFKKDE